METENIITTIKYLMIATGYDVHGKRKQLAKELGYHLPQMTMALTGNRKTLRSYEILQDIERYLRNVEIKQRTP